MLIQNLAKSRKLVENRAITTTLRLGHNSSGGKKKKDFGKIDLGRTVSLIAANWFQGPVLSILHIFSEKRPHASLPGMSQVFF
jgi:hypothetical protein